MRVRKLRLVTPGKQANGQVVTSEHLKQVVKNYKAETRPPITLGHPEKGADQVPAFGRASDLEIDEQGALVLNINYTPELEKREDAGEFEGFSAGIPPHPETGEYYLHHVAACGQLPPAADTKTLELVELSTTTDDIIYLAAEIIKEEIDVTKEELAALLDEKLTPITKKVDALEAKVYKGQDLDDPKKDNVSGQQGTDATTDKPSKELSAVLDTVKADRIANITTTAQGKGLSDDQLKPLLGRLNNAEAVELADNSADGLYQSTMAFINGLDSKSQSNAGLLDNLELSNPGDNGQAFELSDLANKL
ncbi:hypothetical protein HG263_05455 [Pseudoalteromonas sp. JBTF-M23]|uniref:Uncharacterized protein n=1 Tax=Pseudoalteromonas caenipelagi TaxID=2726988 RepID=A0A849V9G3_9GAMM|nr:hypothetical protein [Pseudoalteromonas caenipelagi]NOU49982.1 hypothetical protein [Pseudoalteromonas caenipelagi]